MSVCFTVYLPDTPEPPVVIEVHTTSCTVSYRPPQDDGGAPVSYILQRRTPGLDSYWIRVNHTPVTELQYTVDNLTPATEYEFRVAAVNKKWRSDFSQISLQIMTVETPEKPDLCKVIDVTGTTVRLQWAAPSSSGGADITNYIVMVWTSDEQTAPTNLSVPVDTNMESLMSYTIRNQLEANTKYRFAVAAVSRMGQGPLSDRTEEKMTYAGTLYVAHDAQTEISVGLISN